MKPKPSITIDERGILLHLVDGNGEGVAIPLEPATLLQLSAAVTRAVATLKTPGGRSLLVSAAGALFRQLSEQPTKEERESGTHEAK